MIQKQNMQILLSQVENQLRDTIESQIALADKTGLVEVGDKLAMLEDTLILD